jgi:hypothetical protein
MFVSIGQSPYQGIVQSCRSTICFSIRNHIFDNDITVSEERFNVLLAERLIVVITQHTP